ncbi:hypothetical protein [Ferrimonas sp. SCSIO 43195]|uniref:hypothetical protein n=1 Tax=Ferrimonas sp. SCSIO 43195 TaxID=2822844 RepID=UPI0020756CE9|nr:hypothetical protein [Ferrimonas sp. SCSIO 43195]USD35974.1 hypothetical protein J8Z22_13095 [Ferrimonas sp. SCSIO 43195]
MLKFYTQFSVDHGHEPEAILAVAKTWLDGSPHSSFNRDNLEALTLQTPGPLQQGNEKIQLAHCYESDYQGLGVRHENLDNKQVRWVTEIVGAKIGGRFWISVLLSCDSDTPLTHSPQAKKPYIVRLILEHFGGGQDANLTLTDEPTRLQDNEADFSVISHIINGDSDNMLPVVYCSADEYNRCSVDPDDLAKWLSGMAHVLVEPHRRFSFDLKEATGGKNVYLGAVGIYWPNGGLTRVLPGDRFACANDLAVEVARTIRDSLVTQRSIKGCSWSQLRERVSRSKIRALKQQDSAELEQFVAAFDDELKAKEEQLAAAELTINSLRSELMNLRAIKDHSGSSLVCEGQEQDLYPGERKDLVQEVLQAALKNAQPNTRMFDLIDDLIQANTPVGERARLLAAVKQTLSQYQSMDKKTRSEIEKMGFSFEEENRHYKLMFKGDPRYKINLAKTSSDHRSGKNLVSQIRKEFF